MFKKTVLVVVVLLLVCSVLVSAAELRIDLEVRLKEKPVVGDTFNIAIFATPSPILGPGENLLGETKIKLISNHPNIASFTGNGVLALSALGPAEFTNGMFYLNAAGGSAITSISRGTYLGTLEMRINSDGGSFSIEAVPSESSAISGKSPSVTYYSVYTSAFTGVRRVIPVNQNLPICVPSSFCGSSFCGFADDGCGGFVQCSKVCGGGEICVSNFCQSAVSLVMPGALQPEVNALTAVANALQGKDASGSYLSECLEEAPNFCTLTKLNVIVTAIQSWLQSL